MSLKESGLKLVDSQVSITGLEKVTGSPTRTSTMRVPASEGTFAIV